MTAAQFATARPWVGCVVRARTGVFEVLTDIGTVRASLAGSMLARVARDRRLLPEAGDWVRLREWPDGRVTVEDCCTAPAGATVLPLRRR